MLHKQRLLGPVLLFFAAWLVAACAAPPNVLRPSPQPITTGAGSGNELDAQAQATVDALRRQVAAQLQVTPDAVTVVAVEFVAWPDACLGAAGPDEMCAQVVTPGYKITLAVNGQEYTYHTDLGPHWLRLVAGPAIDIGAPVITGSVTVDNGSCQDVVVGAEGVAFGYCGGAQFGGKFVSPARQATLAEFAARYASFAAETAQGKIAFTGNGPQVATPAEQEQIAGWVQLLVMEAASGVPMGGLAWNGPAELGSDDTTKCAALTMSGGEATTFDCAGNVQDVKLNGGYLTRWLEIQDRFAPFVIETPTERLDFTGMGAESGAVWQRALLAWAHTQYAELNTGRASAAGSTVLAWDQGPTNDMATSCMHVTVLAWGEAYAETRACDGDRQVQDLMTGWLTTAEMEQLDAWLTGYTPLQAEQGYVAGVGNEPADAAMLAAVEQWAAAVWLRIRGVSTVQGGEAAVSASAICPAPAGDDQLLVNAEDGYCLLYPAGYFAERTAPGNMSIVLGSLMNHSDPRVGIEVADAAGRTLAEIGDQFVADYAPGFDVLRGTTTVGGAEALVLDKLPGQDFNRRVAVVYNGRLYSFFFTPLGETDAARTAMETFYQGVLDSFRFLDGAEETTGG